MVNAVLDAEVETLDANKTVPFGTFRDRARNIDISANHIKGMNISLRTAENLIHGKFSSALKQADPNVIFFRLPYNQATVDMIRALVENQYGIGCMIKWWRNDWKRGWIKIKLKESIRWSL